MSPEDDYVRIKAICGGGSGGKVEHPESIRENGLGCAAVPGWRTAARRTPSSGLWDERHSRGRRECEQGHTRLTAPRLDLRGASGGNLWDPRGRARAKGIRTRGEGSWGKRDGPGAAKGILWVLLFSSPTLCLSFPLVPRRCVQERCLGGGRVLGRVASLGHLRPARPSVTECASPLPAVRCRSVAQPVAAAVTGRGSPDPCGLSPGTPPPPSPRPHGGRAGSPVEDCWDCAQRVPARSSPLAVGRRKWSPVASCPLAGTGSPSFPRPPSAGESKETLHFSAFSASEVGRMRFQGYIV